MLNNILKVFNEDLMNAEINTASVSATKIVAAGQTQGALCVNVFAEGSVETKEDLVITLSHGDSENGAFTTLTTITVAADKTFDDQQLMAQSILPPDCKAYLEASAVSDASNSGKIRVTLGYLAR